ncbi:MAG: signal peptidase II [Roseburia sp.]|jgi:signal peptidase II|nr:signal peptidase II [Roseburia sp.]
MSAAEQKINQHLKKGILGLVSACILVFLDLITKHLAVTHLKDQAPVVLWQGVFELRYLENRGAAFGILQNGRMLFLPMTIVFLILILYVFIRRIPCERRYFGMNVVAVLFFSGAVGNFTDRTINGYVVDFFYFCLIDFPIFNVADIYVTTAAGLLILLCLCYYKEEDFERVLPGWFHADEK